MQDSRTGWVKLEYTENTMDTVCAKQIRGPESQSPKPTQS